MHFVYDFIVQVMVIGDNYGDSLSYLGSGAECWIKSIPEKISCSLIRYSETL